MVVAVARDTKYAHGRDGVDEYPTATIHSPTTGHVATNGHDLVHTVPIAFPCVAAVVFVAIYKRYSHF
jgi:hypothetical protein